MKNIQYIKDLFRFEMLQHVIGLLVIGILFSGCENFVEVEVPDTQLTGESVFADANTGKAALVEIYNKLRDNTLVTGRSSGLTLQLGYYADELTPYNISTQSPDQIFFENRLLTTDNTVLANWRDSYNLIYAANAVWEGVEQSSGISEDDKNQLQGEALFLRAYIHFYLLNLYGAIPYITTTDYHVNTTISKKSADEVYPLIINDLEQAKTLLKDAYVSPERVRPNRSVVSALLARVYLYTKNWSAAEAEATLVINNTALYTWVDNLDNVFLKNSTGTLWQLIPGRAGVNTYEAQQFIFTSGPPPSRALSNNLVGAFEVGDQRRVHWIGTVSNGTDTWYYANKYKKRNNTGTSVEYSILFRLEELYLIRSEARAHLENISGAQEDLNKIRNRAGLANTTAATQQDLIQAIVQERRVELFTELGHRWFDLKRTGLANTILASKVGWDVTDILWPLPETELLLNPNLRPQNAGY